MGKTRPCKYQISRVEISDKVTDEKFARCRDDKMYLVVFMVMPANERRRRAMAHAPNQSVDIRWRVVSESGISAERIFQRGKVLIDDDLQTMKASGVANDPQPKLPKILTQRYP